MGVSLKLGLRNLRRRPGRTTLTAVMLAFGTLLLVFSLGLNEGSYAQLVDLATGTWTGHVQVQAPGYQDSPSLFEALPDAAPIIDALQARPEVVAATARVEAGALLSLGNRTVGTLLQGVDPAREPEVSTLPNAVKQGTWLRAEDPEAMPMVVGVGLARRLRAKIGDEITFVGQAADGSTAAELFLVTGLIESGMADVDANLAIVRLSDAQEALSLGSRVHRVVARLTDTDAADDLAAEWRPAEGTTILSWRALLPGLDQSIAADRAGGRIFLLVMLLVVVLGVTNTMLMSVFERTRELGIMTALGTPPRQLVAITLWESTWLSLVSVTVGTLAANGLIMALADTGIRFSDEPLEFGGMAFEVAYPAITLEGSLIFPLIIAAAGVLAGLWPAWRATRLDPVRAIREA